MLARRAFALLLAALLFAPLGASTWSTIVPPTTEPTSPYDDPSFMWFATPAQTGVANPIYLDGVVIGSASVGYKVAAYLGVWADCNEDGFIGAAGILGYPSALLTPSQLAICPDGGPHNQAGLVHEMAWIAPASSTDLTDIIDAHVLVWADPSAPGDAGGFQKTAPLDTLTYDASANGPRWVGSQVWALPPKTLTFYASVSGADGQTPGGVAAYGVPPCSTVGSGAPTTNGWVCDASQWPGAVRVGQSYNLRDIDCDDGAVLQGIPIFLGPGATGDTCDNPSPSARLAHVTIHRFSSAGAALLMAPTLLGWTCVDANTGALVTIGSALALPNPGVQCTPPQGRSTACDSLDAGGYHAAQGGGTLRVTARCQNLQASQDMSLPFNDPGFSATTNGQGSLPLSCVADERNLMVVPAPDYWVFCDANVR